VRLDSAKDIISIFGLERSGLPNVSDCLVARSTMGGFSKNTIMSAISNFSTAYNLTIVSLMLVVSEGVYDASKSQEAAIKSASLAGAIIGQLTMGYYADLAGRSSAMYLTMMLTIMGGLLSSLNLQDIWGMLTMLLSH
jgi:MFS family permease